MDYIINIPPSVAKRLELGYFKRQRTYFSYANFTNKVTIQFTNNWHELTVVALSVSYHVSYLHNSIGDCTLTM